MFDLLRQAEVEIHHLMTLGGWSSMLVGGVTGPRSLSDPTRRIAPLPLVPSLVPSLVPPLPLPLSMFVELPAGLPEELPSATPVAPVAGGGRAKGEGPPAWQDEARRPRARSRCTSQAYLEPRKPTSGRRSV